MLPSLGITDLWTYVLGTVFVVLLPGPNSLFVLATAAQAGIASGYKAACGVFLGDTILMTLSALGIASLLRTEPMFFLLLKYLGAAYLCWLGINMLIAALRSMRRSPQVVAEIQQQKPASRPMRKAFLLSMSNPKAILFFVSFFIQFVDPGYAHPGVSFLVLGLIVQLVSCMYLSLLIFTGARLAQWFRQRQRLASGALSGVGAMFVGFGVKLATATLS
ncbi:leucine efflux protein LeuE [Denitrificimonas caeni]|uniref:Leucine efflux protein LeuE n=1 Tax=Denitrificimonas caeni TaxID=521720 RepID=A0AAE9VU94_9GAMM|nr:leucine efflux protein LeuE [Denitrificimonas caeni]NLJ11808.1 leucine efflux protein LeuE [Gammaproteobacteria bacterium]WBE26615.1 leucine efflux protein LeuE [Denitrificimonas caeni]